MCWLEGTCRHGHPIRIQSCKDPQNCPNDVTTGASFRTQGCPGCIKIKNQKARDKIVAEVGVEEANRIHNLAVQERKEKLRQEEGGVEELKQRKREDNQKNKLAWQAAGKHEQYEGYTTRSNDRKAARKMLAKISPSEDEAVGKAFQDIYADVYAEKRKNLKPGQTLVSLKREMTEEQKQEESRSILRRAQATAHFSGVDSPGAGSQQNRSASARGDTPGSVVSLGWGLEKDGGEWNDVMQSSGLYGFFHPGSPAPDNGRRNQEIGRNRDTVPSAGPTAGSSLLNPVNIAAGKLHSRGSTESSNGSSNETSLPMRPGTSSATQNTAGKKGKQPVTKKARQTDPPGAAFLKGTQRPAGPPVPDLEYHPGEQLVREHNYQVAMQAYQQEQQNRERLEAHWRLQREEQQPTQQPSRPQASQQQQIQQQQPRLSQYHHYKLPQSQLNPQQQRQQPPQPQPQRQQPLQTSQPAAREHTTTNTRPSTGTQRPVAANPSTTPHATSHTGRASNAPTQPRTAASSSIHATTGSVSSGGTHSTAAPAKADPKGKGKAPAKKKKKKK